MICYFLSIRILKSLPYFSPPKEERRGDKKEELREAYTWDVPPLLLVEEGEMKRHALWEILKAPYIDERKRNWKQRMTMHTEKRKEKVWQTESRSRTPEKRRSAASSTDWHNYIQFTKNKYQFKVPLNWLVRGLHSKDLRLSVLQ